MSDISIEKPVISVYIITYNHAAFIAQAIESVLMQKHNYAWEILIGDDCSTDNTPEILKSYAEKYPQLIKLFLRPKNIGYVKNTAELMVAAKGKYVASLDGDDYWIDPLKLQKQVSFLETHPGFAICFHNLKIIQGTDEVNYTLHCSPDQKEVTGFEDIYRLSYIHPASCVYRNGLITLPDWYYNECPINEWPVNIMNAEHGKIEYLPDVMAVYRRHEGAYGTKDIAYRIKKVIVVIRLINKHYKGKYDTISTQSLIRCYNRLLDVYKGRSFFHRLYYGIMLFALLGKYHNYNLPAKGIIKRIINL